MSAAPNPNHKRRIPDALRQRALMSCDRCKRRRVRCHRTPGSGPLDPCRSCVENNARCESTLPRKHRIHGSLEMLSLRYRALDALVKGLFPEQSTDDTDTLFRIADAHHIAMPSPDDLSPSDEVLKQSPTDSTSPPSATVAPTSNQPGEFKLPTRTNPFAHRSTKVLEEKLIPNHHGVAHYVGPSSSFSFAMELRKLVAQRDSIPDNSKWSERRRSEARADFVRLPASKALEPKVTEKDPEDTSGDSGGEPADEGQGRRKSSLGEKHQPEVLHHPSNEAWEHAPKKKGFAGQLPPKETADILVEEFFDKVHPNYLLFHCGAFHIRYEKLWTSDLATQVESDPGWICCVLMVFVFGAQALEQHDVIQAADFQRRYFFLVQSRLYLLINTTSLTNIQAILLLQLYQHNSCQRNAGWMLLGSASRQAFALGMHREGATANFDPIERQVRRRVWWTLYQFEQDLCMVLGRPSAIEDAEVNIGLPNERLLDGGDCIPPGYLEHSIRLTRISQDVKRHIYAVPANAPQHEQLPDATVPNALLERLDSWSRSLPPPLQLQCTSLGPKQRRAILLLHIHRHHTASLITRPWILQKARIKLTAQQNPNNHYPPIGEAEDALSNSSGDSAREAMILFRELAMNGMLDGVSWLDVYYAYHAVLILCLDFLWRTDEPDSKEDVARKAVVRDVLWIVRNHKLCRTWQTLANVAAQFARVVDILEDSSPLGESAVPNAQTTQPMPEPTSRIPPDMNATYANNFPMQGILDPSWDFLDVWGDTFANMAPVNGMVDANMNNMPEMHKFAGTNFVPLDYMGYHPDHNAAYGRQM